MAQGVVVGCTDYSIQSIEDILEDVINWEDFAEQDLEYITEMKKKSNYTSFPVNFQIYVNRFEKNCKTFITDFNRIKNAIKDDRITNVEIKLLRNISVCADNELKNFRCYFNNEIGYGDSNYYIEEEIYSHICDAYGTLIDAANAAKRMEDYKMDENKIINNGNYIINSPINNSNITVNGDINSSISYDDLSEIIKECLTIKETNCENDDIEYIKNELDKISGMISKKSKKNTIISAFKGLLSFCANVGANAFVAYLSTKF